MLAMMCTVVPPSIYRVAWLPGATGVLRQRQRASGCTVPLCLVVHGRATDAAGLLRLQAILSQHLDVPGLVVLQNAPPDREMAVTSLNTGHDTQELLRKLAARYRNDRTALINAVMAAAVGHLQACSVWEMDLGAAFLAENGVVPAMIAQAVPRSAETLGHRDVYVGVRPRGESYQPSKGTAHTSRDIVLPAVNACTLFSPSAYYAPRGFPKSLVHDDTRGQGVNAPELIRIEMPADDTMDRFAVVQSCIDGAPDTDERSYSIADDRVHHNSVLPGALVVPHGVFHPYNRLATLHRHGALWALYSPVSWSFRDSDVLRGYVAQAIFPLVGLHFTIAPPLLTRNQTDDEERGHRPPAMEAVVAFLADWSRTMIHNCAEPTTTKSARSTEPCVDAGSLLIHAYDQLYRHQHAARRDVSAAKAWVRHLLSVGYDMPTLRASLPATASPRRPPATNVHMAVQVNAGDRWGNVVPVWHALYAAEYTQVSYHLARRPEASEPIGLYPRITHVWDEPLIRDADPLGGLTPGYFGYQSTLKAWAIHDRTTEALVWTNDDAFVRAQFLRTWLQNASSCAAASEGHARLNQNISTWPDGSNPNWIKHERGRTAAQHFRDIVAVRVKEATHCSAADSAVLSFGPSDVFAIRTTCARNQPQVFLKLLQAASDAGLFLEIAVPSIFGCAFPETAISRYRWWTVSGKDRNDPSVLWQHYEAGVHDVYHPAKLSRTLTVMLRMRDHQWARAHRRRV